MSRVSGAGGRLVSVGVLLGAFALAGCNQAETLGNDAQNGLSGVAQTLGKDTNNFGGLIQPGQLVGGSTRQIAGAQPIDNFLPSPGLLGPGGPGEPDLLYRNPAVAMASYNQVLLDPVIIQADPNSSLRSASRAQRQQLAATFYKSLASALQTRCQMTNVPGPSTVRLHFALVSASAPNATVNTMATYAPYASTAYSLASMAFNHGVGYFAGTATAEAYATDSNTGALLWQAVDKRGGTTALMENTLNTWNDVDHAFQAWANELVLALQNSAVCS